MRREGRRQHGILRTYRILPPPLNPRMVNSLTSPLTTGLFTKLPSKPTKAHRRVWSGQVHWVRSNDIASSSYKLLTWRVVTKPVSGSVSNLPGFLVTGIVDLNGNVDECEEAGVGTMNTENNEDNSGKEDGGSHDDDESTSFYDVGMMMMMDHVLEDDDEEDGWCLV